MAYGCLVNNEKGQNVTGIMTPVFYLAAYSLPAGNVDFGTSPQGRTLRYHIVGTADGSGAGSAPVISVSGGRASWNGVNSAFSRLFFYWG